MNCCRSWGLALLWLSLHGSSPAAPPAPSAFTPGQQVPVNAPTVGTAVPASPTATASAAATSLPAPTLAASCAGVLAQVTSDPASAPRVRLLSGAGAEAQLNRRSLVTIEVHNPKPLVSCLADSRTEPVLFIDHVALPDLKPVAKIADLLDDNPVLQLVYRLQRTPDSKRQWEELLLRDWLNSGEPRTLTLGLGVTPLFELAVLPKGAALSGRFGAGGRSSGLWALALAFVVFLVLSHCSKLVRDRAPKLADQPPAGRKPSYSLARVLLSFWVLTTTAAIVVVYLSSGTLPALDGGVPLLLLASGLTVGSTAVIETIGRIGVGGTAWFLEDILTDKDGLAIHRVQALIVNLLLLIVVWQELICEGTIANVERGWGVLMGISAGVYLYGKTTEATV